MLLELCTKKDGVKTTLYYGEGERDSLPRRGDIVQFRTLNDECAKGVVAGIIFDYFDSEPKISILVHDIVVRRKKRSDKL